MSMFNCYTECHLCLHACAKCYLYQVVFVIVMQCYFAQKVVMLSFVLAIVMLNIVVLNVAMLTIIYAECHALLLYWVSLC
jgi:hypothetical protein